MGQFIITLFIAALVYVTMSLYRVYRLVPHKEIRRRARHGDSHATAVYPAVAYGADTMLLLWLVIGLATGTLFVLVVGLLPDAAAAIVVALLLWLYFAWLPRRRVNAFDQLLARRLTPLIAFGMHYGQPLLGRINHFVARTQYHTGLYQKEDLLEVIERQQGQGDNRIAEEELRIASHALTFGDKVIRDVMIPRRTVKMVSDTDTIGPVLLDELHESGYSRFPVYQKTQDHIVGVLYMRSLITKTTGGLVKTVMDSTVCYVHEEDPLADALQAFLKTRHHLAVVVNSFEEVTGILTLEDVLEQIIGRRIVDEFDQYEDLRAVAAKQAREARAEK